MDRGAWWVTVRGVAELDMTEQLCTAQHSTRAFSWGIIFYFGKEMILCSASGCNGNWASQVALVVKNPPPSAGDTRQELDPWVRKVPGEGNGSPLQYGGLENPVDGEAWRATVQGVTHSQICLKLHSMHARAFSWGIIFCFGRKVLFCSASCYNGSRGSGEKLARLI